MSDDRAVVALLERGASPTEVARILSTNRTRVYRVMRRNVVVVNETSDEVRAAMLQLNRAYAKFEASASVTSYGALIDAREGYEAARQR